MRAVQTEQASYGLGEARRLREGRVYGSRGNSQRQENRQNFSEVGKGYGSDRGKAKKEGLG